MIIDSLPFIPGIHGARQRTGANHTFLLLLVLIGPDRDHNVGHRAPAARVVVEEEALKLGLVDGLIVVEEAIVSTIGIKGTKLDCFAN